MATTDVLVNYVKRHSSMDGSDGLYVGTELDSISKSVNLLNDTVKAVSVQTIPLTQLATIVTGSFLGNFSGSTAVPSVYTATQITAQLNAMVGATGTVAGTKGLVPAPAATDNTKYLRGDATYQTIDLTPYAVKANNLSDLANAATARTNLGLGTAATLNVGTGANNIVQLDASSKLPAVDGSALTNLTASGRLISINNYTTSQTITIPAGATKAYIKLAGGGASGGAANQGGTGGGGGGGLFKYLTGLTPGNTLALTIGTGGAGVGSGGAGNNGNNSTLASGTQTISTLTASGGTGGTSSTNGTASGGAATGGDLNFTGGEGVGLTGANNALTASFPFGWGGASIFASSTFGLGSAPLGAGGGSAPGGSSSANGADGLCIIEWFA